MFSNGAFFCDLIYVERPTLIEVTVSERYLTERNLEEPSRTTIYNLASFMT